LAPWLYPLPLHDALPIYLGCGGRAGETRGELGVVGTELRARPPEVVEAQVQLEHGHVHRDHAGEEDSDEHDPDDPVRDPRTRRQDRKSTRLNSSHVEISY